MRRRTGLRLLAAVGAAALLVVAHLRARAVGLGVEGPLLVVDHVYQALLVAAFLTLCLAVGDRLISLVGPEDLEPVDRLLASVLVGGGGIAVLMLAAGLAGVLEPPVILGVLVLSGGWARRELARAPDLATRAVRDLPTPVLVVAGLVGAVLLFPALTSPADWDSLMYHLQIPDRFLSEGRIFLPPDNLHVAYVGLVHMLYLPLLAFGGSSAPALLSLAMGLLLPVAVYRLGRRVFGPETGEMSGVAVWGTATLALVAATARVDVTTALFLVVAHSTLYDALAARDGRRRLMLAAAMLGLAVGVKYQAGAYVLALLPFVAWAAFRGGSGDDVGWQDALLLGGIVALVASPWFVKNWILLDAPFYPFLADRLLPPWLADLHGVRTVPESVDPEVFGALREVRRPFDPVAAFFDPGRLSVEGEAAHYHLSPLLLLLPAWVLRIRDRKLAWVAGPAMIYLALVLTAAPRTNLRYLVPAVPALTVAASALAVQGLRSVSRRLGDGAGAPGRVRVAALAVAAASLIPAGASLYGWLPGAASVDHVLGAQSRIEHISARRSPAMVIHTGLTDYGEHPLPDDARVLMLFEARGYYLTVPGLQDNNLTNWALLAPLRGKLDCLRSTDITHVLVGKGVLDYYFRRGLDPGTVRWPSFQKFARRCLEKDLEVPGFVLYRVPGGGTDPPRGDGGSPEASGGGAAQAVGGRGG